MADLTEFTVTWRDCQREDEDGQWSCRHWFSTNCGCAQLLATGCIILFGMLSFIAGYYIGAYHIF
jgi:hypothetical protein